MIACQRKNEKRKERMEKGEGRGAEGRKEGGRGGRGGEARGQTMASGAVPDSLNKNYKEKQGFLLHKI